MSQTPSTPISDPRGIVSSLNADAIITRMNELDSEMEALRVLLRAAKARERVERRTARPQEARRAN
jgi:hypothetical protein